MIKRILIDTASNCSPEGDWQFVVTEENSVNTSLDEVENILDSGEGTISLVTYFVKNKEALHTTINVKYVTAYCVVRG